MLIIENAAISKILKKLLTTLILCICMTITYANSGNSIGTKASKTVSKKTKKTSRKAACEQTRSVDVYINGQYVTTVTATRSFSSDDPQFVCAIAGSMASSAAQELADEWARNAGAYPDLH